MDLKEPMIIEDFYKDRPPRKTKIAPTLRGDRQGLKVILGASGQMTSTNTQVKSIKNTGQKSQKLQATLGESMKKESLNMISFARAFLARPSLLPGKGKVSRILVARYSSRYVELRNITDLSCYYSKTLKAFSTMTEEELSAQSSTPWKTWGIGGSTRFLTARITGSHRIGKECSLSDILEKDVPDRYFLSPERARYLIEQKNNLPLEPSQQEPTAEETTAT